MKHAIRNIHFIGIGGAGMSGIAEVLHNLGYSVSGSDLIESSTLKRLKKLNIKTYIGHSIDNLLNADVVVLNLVAPHRRMFAAPAVLPEPTLPMPASLPGRARRMPASPIC